MTTMFRERVTGQLHVLICQTRLRGILHGVLKPLSPRTGDHLVVWEMEDLYDQRRDPIFELHTPPKDSLDAWAAGAEFVRFIGDIHGMYHPFLSACRTARSAGGRVFLMGDIINRGSRSQDCMRLAVEGYHEGWLRMVPGNHDHRLYLMHRRPDEVDDTRFLDSDALARTREEFEAHPDNGLLDAFCDLIETLPLWQRVGGLHLVHAALPADALTAPAARIKDINRHERQTTTIAVWGDRMSVNDMPSYNWVADLPAETNVLVGHYPACRQTPVRVLTEAGATTLLLDTGAGPVPHEKEGFLSWIDMTYGEILAPAATLSRYPLIKLDELP